MVITECNQCNECNPTIGSLLHQRKLYFLGKILTLPNVAKAVLDILKLRLNMLNVGNDSKSTGFLGKIYTLEIYNSMPYLHLWQRVSIFHSYRKWKQIVNSRIFKHERAYFLTASEEKPVLKLTLNCICQLFTCKLLVTHME